MVRLVAVACAVALMGCAASGCATTESVNGPAGLVSLAPAPMPGAGPVGVSTGRSGLEGQQLDAALSRYGFWSERVTTEGTPTYIWRRSLMADERAYFCELRVETAFRQTISRSVVQGFPDACRLFAQRTRG
jgi:hypothetical protein